MLSDFNNIQDKLNFINISTDDMTLYEWKPPHSFKSYILDLNIVKEHATDGIFFHIYKGNSKLVHIRKNNLIYTVGAVNEIQFHLLEALLEHIDIKFNEMFDIPVITSFENVSPSIFKNFDEEIEKIIRNFKDLNLVKKINVHCRVCKKILPIFVKKSFVESADSYPVPLVYSHQGHAILCFIDKNFDVRGVELVNVTG
jgi:hypothetical protein